MKKLLIAAFAVLVLAGCGSSSKKEETKTCSITEEGMKMDATFTAVDDDVTKAKIAVKMDASALGADVSKLTDEQKKQVEDMVLSQLGVEAGKGVDVSAEINEKEIVVSIGLDLKDGDSATLKKLGFGIGEDTFKLSETVKEAEADGAVCK